MDYRTEVPQGYLKVYSATDRFEDRNARYFPHSSYAIYTIEGRLFENVKNHRSAEDEVPEVVALPVGTYARIAHKKLRPEGDDLVVQRRRDELARLLIKIRRGEAGYDLVKKFLHENKGLPPETEV